MLRTRARRVARRVPGLYAVCRLVLETLRQCMRYRVTGLASEAGFFALLSFPPLVYGLLGVMGYVGGALGGRTVDDIVRSIERYLEGILSGEALQNVVMPTTRSVSSRRTAHGFIDPPACHASRCAMSSRTPSPVGTEVYQACSRPMAASASWSA